MSTTLLPQSLFQAACGQVRDAVLSGDVQNIALLEAEALAVIPSPEGLKLQTPACALSSLSSRILDRMHASPFFSTTLTSRDRYEVYRHADLAYIRSCLDKGMTQQTDVIGVVLERARSDGEWATHLFEEFGKTISLRPRLHVSHGGIYRNGSPEHRARLLRLQVEHHPADASDALSAGVLMGEVFVVAALCLAGAESSVNQRDGIASEIANLATSAHGRLRLHDRLGTLEELLGDPSKLSVFGWDWRSIASAA